MSKKLLTIGLAAATVVATFAATVQDAEARRGRGVAIGVAAGVIGLGLLGAAASANAGPRYYYGGGGACYRGPRECYNTGARCWYDRYGDYVCSRGNYVCRRPLICP